MKQSLVEKYLCKKKKPKITEETMNESSELWFGSWSGKSMIYVRANKVLWSGSWEFPSGSPMGESERKAAQARGYILLDW
jgi:hypothetical protein